MKCRFRNCKNEAVLTLPEITEEQNIFLGLEKFNSLIVTPPTEENKRNFCYRHYKKIKKEEHEKLLEE